MPLRALGYLTSALVIQQEYLPQAQVQLVHTLHAAARANGGISPRAKRQANYFNAFGMALIDEMRYKRRVGSDVIFAADPSQPPAIDLEAVGRGLERLDPALRAKLEQGAARRNGSVTPYIAAHLLMHDTNPMLEPMHDTDFPPVEARHVISLGAQSERPFYAARMACKAADISLPDTAPATAQLFTRHVLPPYFACRQGEPELSDIELLAGPAIDHPLSSVARDLNYLRNLSQGAI
jgi:hypothetical protein